jgi:hypothetical protein
VAASRAGYDHSSWLESATFSETFESRCRSTQVPTIGLAQVIRFPLRWKIDIFNHETLIFQSPKILRKTCKITGTRFLKAGLYEEL